MSHDLSLSRSLPISIYASLTVVYSAGASVVLNGSQRHSSARLSTMEMNVDSIHELEWMRRYAVSIYFFQSGCV